jgi:hypothetical protein
MIFKKLNEWPVCIFVMHLFATVISFVVAAESDVSFWLPFTIVMTFIAGAIPMVADGAINKWINFVTDKERSWDNAIQQFLFKDEWDYWDYKRLNTPNKYFLTTANIQAWIVPVVLTITFPVLLWVVIPVASIIGLVYGMALLTRKVYRINKKLGSHINDKSLHDFDNNNVKHGSGRKAA